MPFFSVVIPALNAAATLPATLTALQEQTCSDWEAIVVDDGSTDDTPRVVERHAARDSRLSPFPIHSCAVRRSAVVAAGGFDTAYVTCEDWDSDAVVQHLVGASGFLIGVMCRFGSSALDDGPLRLPRIE
ncbi:MAG TPA: glycosyltransferase, partial [Candidatus Elarobacter sp.]|nr:glycosyltransferase [Candidatus Elarobacter sp.]